MKPLRAVRLGVVLPSSTWAGRSRFFPEDANPDRPIRCNRVVTESTEKRQQWLPFGGVQVKAVGEGHIRDQGMTSTWMKVVIDAGRRKQG